MLRRLISLAMTCTNSLSSILFHRVSESAVGESQNTSDK